MIEELENLFYSTASEKMKRKVRRFVRQEVCPECKGTRLVKESLGVKIGGKNIVEMAALSIQHACEFFYGLQFSGNAQKIAEPILKEIHQRLQFLNGVGLAYLT